jgi:hypothetical protein
MNCQQVRNDIKAYIDCELGPVARRRVESHLAQCAECRKELSAMTDLTNEVKNVPTVPTPEGLRMNVLRGIEFEPPAGRRQTRGLTKGVLTILGSVAAFLLVVAIIFPVMQPARERSRSMLHDSDADYMIDGGSSRGLDEASSEYSPGSPGAASEKAKSLAKPTKSNVLTALSARPEAEYLIIIKTADVSIKVKNLRQASDQSTAIAKSVGGYVTDSSVDIGEGGPASGTVTIRVPVDDFERTVERLGGLGKVESKKITGKDVSGEVVDLEARVRNKRAEERQYLEIMNRAQRIPDIVTVSDELYRVRGEIEQAQGRLKYLRSAAAMSTINLTLSEKTRKPVVKGQIQQSLTNSFASLVGTGKGLASMLIWLAMYSPFWGLGLFVVLRLRKRAAVSV